MSEYWVSTPKYWCKHCATFVTDTPLSRKNHDATGKHQGALKRFLRDLHRNNERALHASENAKREVARLNAIVDGGSSSSSSSSFSSTAVGPVQVAKPEQKSGERWGVAKRGLTEDEKKKQMAELEALGVAMPEDYRGDLALPGEWTTVSVEQGKNKKMEKELLQEELAEMKRKEKEENERKRRWEELDDDEKAIRGFRIQQKTYAGAMEGMGMTGDDDGSPPLIPLKFEFGKSKIKLEDGLEEEEEEEEEEKKKKKEENAETEKTMVTVKTEDEIKKEETVTPPITNIPENIKSDKEDTPIPAAAPPAESGVVFKKRKVKTMRKK